MKTAYEWAEEINIAANEQGGFDSVEDMEKWIKKVQNDTLLDCIQTCNEGETLFNESGHAKTAVGCSCCSDNIKLKLIKE